MTTDYDAWIGKRLGKYQILRALGRGGMGIVYEAEDTHLQRPVALKLLPESLARDAIILKRFLLEARAAARLSHPNVVAVYDIGQRDGTYYLALELVRGANLKQILTARGALPWADATRACADVCRGLAAAHAADLIHRDVKPSNILVAGVGNQELGKAWPANAVIKIADFGLAKFTTQTTPRLTTLNCTVGTPAYMSPEQCRNETVDALSDIYSLGATYFALLTGRPPYLSDGNDLNTLAAHCSARVPDPRLYCPEVPAACAAVVTRAMAKQRSERYTGAQEMLGALTAAGAASQPSFTAFANVPQATLVQPTVAAATTQRLHPVPAAVTQPPRWRRLALIALLALLACGGLTAYLFWRGAANGPPALHDAAKASPAPIDAAPPAPALITLRPLRKLEGHGASVVGLAFRPDGKRLVSVDNRSVRVWDVDTGAVKEPVAYNQKITAMALFPGGKMLAVATLDQRVFLWNLQTEEPLGGFGPFRDNAVSMAASPDSKLLAVGTDSELQVWDVEGPPQRKYAYPKTQYYVSGVSFSGDGKLLAWVNYQKEVHIVDTTAWQPRAEFFQQPGEMSCVTFTADDSGVIFGGCVADPGDGMLMRWDFTRNGEKPRPLPIGKGIVHALALLPGTTSLLHSERSGGAVRVLDLKTERSRAAAIEDTTRLKSLAVSADGRFVAGGMANGSIQLWEVVRDDNRP